MTKTTVKVKRRHRCGSLAAPVLAAALIGAALPSSTRAGELDIEQSGRGGSIHTTVASELSLFDVGIAQSGTENELTLDIGRRLEANIRQHGNFGLIDLDVGGIGEFIDIDQGGDANRLYADIGGRLHSATIVQSGNRNAFELGLSGELNRLDVEQSGDGNQIDLDHGARGGTVVLRQLGDANRLEIGALSGNTSVSVTQSGSGETLTVSQ